MKLDKRLFFSCFFLLIGVGSLLFIFFQNYTSIANGDNAAEKRLQKYTSSEQTYAISEHQGIRDRHFSDYAVGDDLIFFSYSKGSVIDAYAYSGAFQFSIILPDKNNGVVAVRCANDQVYACAKDNTVYIFKDDQFIEKLSYEQAKNHGYTYNWFYKQPKSKIDKTYIYLLDESGVCVSQINTPQIIKNNWPIFDFPDTVDRFVGLTLLVLIVVSWIVIITLLIRRSASRRKKPYAERL